MTSAALSASSLPVDEAFQTRYELIPAGGQGWRDLSTKLELGKLSDSPVSRIEVRVHDDPFRSPGLLAAGHDESWLEAHTFVLVDPKVEATVPQRHGDWIETSAMRLAELAALKPGWDGHDGMAPDFDYISQAIEFLVTVMGSRTPAPSIVPTSDGGLQLEWHRAGLDVEILFSPEEDSVLYIHERATGDEREVPPVGGFLEFELGKRLAD